MTLDERLKALRINLEQVFRDIEARKEADARMMIDLATLVNLATIDAQNIRATASK